MGGVTLLKSIIGGREGEEVASDTANSEYDLPGQLMRETNAPPSQSHLMRTEKQNNTESVISFYYASFL